MLRPLRIQSPDHKVFMTSDLHLGHGKVAIKRGFGSVVDHDNSIVHAWNAACDLDSHVFSLGDIMTDDKTGDKLKTFLRRVHFDTLFALGGNHASGWSRLYVDTLKTFFPDAVRKDEVLYEVYPLSMRLNDGPKTVVFLPQYIEVKMNDAFYCLSHYPIVSHNRMGSDSMHCHGHCHSGLELTNVKTGRGKRLDVGWDGFGRPVSVSEIKRILESRDIDAWDHHTKRETGNSS